MNVNWTTALLFGAFILQGCSTSGPKKREMEKVDNKDTIQRDYIVRNASARYRPTWIENASQWAINNDRDLQKLRFFSFETEPKANREIACNLAKANAKANIAGEITTFITKNLGSSQAGQASIDANNPVVTPLREYVENTLTEKIQGLIIGASIKNSYWEKRNYKQDMGAKRDYIGFTCAVLVQMDAARLQQAMDMATQDVLGQVDDPSTKENVKAALKEANVEFQKQTQGQL